MSKHSEWLGEDAGQWLAGQSRGRSPYNIETCAAGYTWN